MLGWVFTHLLAAMRFGYSVRSLANSVTVQVVLLLLWLWAPVNRNCHTKERNSFVSVSIEGSSTPLRSSDWRKIVRCTARRVLFSVIPYKVHLLHGFIKQRSEACFFPPQYQQALCKCRGKIKTTENAVLSSGSEGMSNTPVIIQSRELHADKSSICCVSQFCAKAEKGKKVSVPSFLPALSLYPPYSPSGLSTPNTLNFSSLSLHPSRPSPRFYLPLCVFL